MSKLLIVCPVCADSGPTAERLLDWIATLNGKIPKGRILLAFAADLHQEMRVKLRISAEIGFESVSELNLAAVNPAEQQNKVFQINSMFRQVSAYIQSHCRWPWLLLEPDCVPLKSGWLEVLADAYDSQEKRYCGSQMQTPDKKLFMARVGIYHPGASSELHRFCNDPNVGFEFVSGDHVIPRCTKTKLIQQFQITDDASLGKIRPDAVLLHGDKWGKVIAKLRVNNNGHPTIIEGFTELGKRLESVGLPKPTLETVTPFYDPSFLVPDEEQMSHIDLRTKAGRALKAQLEARKKSTPLQTT